MELISSLNIYQGDYGKYYILDGEKYDIHFPLFWALTHKLKNEKEQIYSGPKDCNNCKKYGSVNNVFVKYCNQCCDLYDGERGINPENIFDEYASIDMWLDLPYMRGVYYNNIGYKDKINDDCNINININVCID